MPHHARKLDRLYTDQEQTDSIENYLNLQLRNRQAIKRKLHLQQEILEIKKQRQLVAVQQDEVRNKYENASKQNQVCPIAQIFIFAHQTDGCW